MFDEQYLECYFVRSLYKILAGEPLSWHDVEDFDNEFYNNLKWLLENQVDENFDFYFAEEADFFGRVEVRDLVEGGRDKAVNEENKREYVEKKSFFKLYDSIKAQVDNFLDGFYEMIPRRLATIFDSKELELLISGLPTVNIFDLKENTEYSNYSSNTPVIVWLFEVLEEFDESERAEFLQFVTGKTIHLYLLRKLKSAA